MTAAPSQTVQRAALKTPEAETPPALPSVGVLATDWAEGMGEHLDSLDVAAFEIEQDATDPAILRQVEAIRRATDLLRTFRIDMLCTAARAARLAGDAQ